MDLRRVRERVPAPAFLTSSPVLRRAWRRLSISPEDRFTPPSELCPHPGWWHSPDGQSAEVEVTDLVVSFVRALQPEIVVETGTAHGQTAYAIGKALRTNGHGRLYTMDVHPGRVANARRMCRRLPVTVEEMSSLDFTPPGPVDFAWFDSLLLMRADEFRRYHPWMHDGTIVGFHDTAPHHVGMADRIEVLASEGLLHPIFLPTPRGVCFAQVRATA